MIEWGLHIGGKRPELFLERFDLTSEERVAFLLFCGR